MTKQSTWAKALKPVNAAGRCGKALWHTTQTFWAYLSGGLNDAVIKAATLDFYQLLPALIARGVDTKTIETALWAAAQKEHIKSMQILEKQCVDSHPTNTNPLLSLLMKRLAENGHAKAIQVLIKECNVKCDDKTLYDMLMSATNNRYPRTMRALIECGANVNYKDTSSRSPLLSASYLTSHSAMKVLCEAGANVHDTDDRGRTPLHLAAKNQCVNSCQILIEFGAKLDATDREGDTPVMLAAKWSGTCADVLDIIDGNLDPNHTFKYLLDKTNLNPDNSNFKMGRAFARSLGFAESAGDKITVNRLMELKAIREFTLQDSNASQSLKTLAKQMETLNNIPMLMHAHLVTQICPIDVQNQILLFAHPSTILTENEKKDGISKIQKGMPRLSCRGT